MGVIVFSNLYSFRNSMKKGVYEYIKPFSLSPNVGKGLGHHKAI